MLIELAVEDLEMPAWLAREMDEQDACPDLVPEVPAWLLDAPLSVLEPGCDCGCARLHEPPVEPDAEPVRWAVPGVWGEEPVIVTPSVGELVAELDHVVGLLGAVDPTVLTPDRALGEAAALAGVQHRLRVLQLARTQDVKDRELFAHLGYRSLSAWQRDTAPDAAFADRTLSKRLMQFRHLSAALRASTISFAAATKVGAALSKVRGQLDRPDGMVDGQPGEPVVEAVLHNVLDLVAKDRAGLADDSALLATVRADISRILLSGGSQLERVEQAMVLLATHLSLGSLPNALEELVLQLLPTLLEDRERAAADKRALGLRPNSDGTWDLHATLTPEAGEQLFTALAAEARRDPANPLDTQARAQARTATGQTEADLPGWERRTLLDNGDLLSPDGHQELVPRSRSKRLHDAFQRLLTRYLTHGLGGLSGKVPVQVTVTTHSDTVEGAPGAPPARGASGRPLARSLLRRWWCDANITTVLMSHGWKPLGVVHSARTITGTELKAVRAQYDNRCPGLDCCPGRPDPLTPLVPHHVLRHAVHGRTSIEETLLVCERLHQDIHLGKRTIRLRDGSLITEAGYLTDA